MPAQINSKKSTRTLFEYYYTILIGAFVIVYTLSWVIRENPSLNAVPWLYAILLIIFDLLVLIAVRRLLTKGKLLRKSNKTNMLLALQQILYIGGILAYNLSGLSAGGSSETRLFLYLLVTWLLLPVCFRTEIEPDALQKARYNMIFVMELVISAAIFYLVLDGWLAGY